MSVRKERRVSLVSEDLSLPIDEGLKKFVYSIMEPMERDVDLQVLSTMAASRPDHRVRIAPANVFMWGKSLRTAISSFKPDVVIYVARAGGTRNSFIRSRVLRSYAPKSRHAMVSLQPRPLGRGDIFLARLCRPDVFVAQSKKTRDLLLSLGIPAVAIPSGVDVNLFEIAQPAEKARLRIKYGLSPDRPIILHIGHMQRSRNVLLLDRLQRERGYQSVMVSSTSTHVEPDVLSELECGGVRVINSYVENVAELYQLADCYLFPVHVSSSAIEMPLSVLEAMACGTPVVTTRFGSLVDWLSPAPGFRYADTDDDLLAEVKSVVEGACPGEAAIRDQVLTLSWNSVARRLLDVVGVRAESSWKDLRASADSSKSSPTYASESRQ